MIFKAVIGLLSTLIFSASMSVATAQTGQWVYGLAGVQDTGERITELADGDFVSCGNRLVTRIDGPTTTIEWVFSAMDFYPRDVVETTSGRIAVAGTHFGPNSQSSVVMFLLDAFGAVLSQRVYPGNDQYQLLELITTSDGGFLIAVEANDPNSGAIHPLLIKTDSTGMEMWMYRYDSVDFAFENAAFCFVEEQIKNSVQSYYHLTGRFKGDLTTSIETLMMTVDQDGAVQAAATIGFDNHSDYGRGLRRKGDQLLVTGYSKEIGEGGGTYLMLLDMGFNVIWYYGLGGFTGTKELYFDSDDNILLAGSTSFPNPNDNAAIISCQFTDPTNIFGMQYGGQLEEDGRDLAKDVLTGGYALLGSTRTFGFAEWDQYIVRMDANFFSGCYESDWAPPVAENQIPMAPLDVIRVAVASASQFQLEPEVLEYFEEPICESPPEPCDCVDPPVDMVGWWTFDESAGIVAADSIAGNDGTWVGNPLPVVGKVDNCLDFDGFDDYVSIPSSSLLDYVNPNELTIDAWIYLDGTNPVNYEPIVSRLNANQMGYVFSVHNDRLEMYLGGVIQFETWTGTTAVPHNEWVHVAVVANRFASADYGVTFYINGVAEGPFGFPALPIAAIVPGTDARIGSTEFVPFGASTEQFFDGKIDEVEIFNRALDAAEIQGIYNAGDCGKCKVICDPPWDKGFCIDDLSIVVGIPVCNYSPIDANVELSFAGLAVGICGGIDGPTNFTVISPGNPLLIPGNQCVTVMVEIERPVQMVAVNQVGCYEVTVTNLDNGSTSRCRGSVQDKRNLCPLDPYPNDDVAMIVGVPTQIRVPIRNTAYEGNVITWRAVAYGPNMELSDNYSLNGGEPGTSASGKLETAIGEISELQIDVMAMNFEFGYSDLVIYTQEEGELYPLTSIMMRAVLSEVCTGDFNGSGIVDGGDLGLLLSAWGKCPGCPEDLNGDGTVNGGDLGILLALFGPCP